MAKRCHAPYLCQYASQEIPQHLPLARRNDENDKIVDVFQVIIAGAEICNAYSELVNPNEQRASFEEQLRIVDILDRFDTLCNDISASLPTEIEARQKQYEYYRDKLLTFKEIEV